VRQRGLSAEVFQMQFDQASDVAIIFNDQDAAGHDRHDTDGVSQKYHGRRSRPWDYAHAFSSGTNVSEEVSSMQFLVVRYSGHAFA